jgi:hypothetical protein
MSDETGLTLDSKPTEEALQKLLLQGDLSSLTMQQRAQFLYHLAVSKGLDPTTMPFNLIVLNNKLTVYANRSCADQIRKRDGITSKRIYNGPLRFGFAPDGSPKFNDSVWEVEYELTDKGGRVEVSTGCVGIKGLDGEALGNAVMKADTKAKRRGTLSMGGLGFLDELEVESVQTLKEGGGVGQPRRVFPRPAASAAPLDANNVIDAEPAKEEPVTAESSSEPSAAPPSFNNRKPLPVARPPVKL